MATLSRAEFGRRLQLVRASIWYEALAGDGYAGLLRGFAAQPPPPLPAMPGLSRSRLGAWICTDPAVAERILGDERFGVRRADGGKPHLQVLPLDETFLGAEPSAQRRIAELLGPELGAVRADTVRRHADALLAGCGDEFELVGDVAEPLAVRVLAELFGLDGIAGELPALATALDALRTPPALADALALARASRALRDTLAATADGDLLAGRVLATVLVLATVPTLLGNAVRSPAHAGDPASVVDGALHAHPPVRLLCRVAHTAADIAGTTVAAGEEVVVPVAAGRRAVGLLRAEPRWRMVEPLVRLLATTGLAALRARYPTARTQPPRWHPRSPVTARMAWLGVTG
ncbi:hypothetical protein ACFS2C_07730 [Prauserella oleivorans]|uniref:Cytochrome P450 n=1 Tax=Prauserella oleivorans TaxID=1478153 RepID=A0ABW5W6T2_9PSEU